MLHACFIPIATCFASTLCHFYTFSGTNLLTRCRSASSCFVLFLFPENYFCEYSRNCTKQKAKSLFFQHVHGVRRRDEDSPRGGQTIGRRGRGAHRAVWWFGPLGGSADIAPSPIYSPRRENPKTPSLSSRTYSLPPPSSTLTRGVLKLFPAPCRRGESSPEGSTSPCPPPE